jgi:2-iminobutanoate/2-iminopropanoate deaminase
MKSIVSSTNAPKAIGPYSQAVVHGGIAYLSGQIPLDAVTGQIVGESIGEQTDQVLKNLGAVLVACGSGFDQVLRTTVYLADIAEFPAMNEVYARYFPSNPPARATIQAARLPRDVRVEIDCIAIAQAQE